MVHPLLFQQCGSQNCAKTKRYRWLLEVVNSQPLIQDGFSKGFPKVSHSQIHPSGAISGKPVLSQPIPPQTLSQRDMAALLKVAHEKIKLNELDVALNILAKAAEFDPTNSTKKPSGKHPSGEI